MLRIETKCKNEAELAIAASDLRKALESVAADGLAPSVITKVEPPDPTDPPKQQRTSYMLVLVY